MALLGLVLGTAGLFVATRAAENQPFAPFVQLWSVPPIGGGEQVIGVRNVTGRPIDCDVLINRPSLPTYGVRIGTIDDGQSWVGSLPSSEASGPGPWDILLHCGGADGSSFDRRLKINPPA